MKLLAIVKNHYYYIHISRSSNLRVNELFHIAMYSQFPCAIVLKYRVIYEDSETTNWSTKRNETMDAQHY